MVPRGNYEAEEKTLKEIEKLDYVDSALGLANVSINDDYVLTDKISPRDFSELADLDIDDCQALYVGLRL